MTGHSLGRVEYQGYTLSGQTQEHLQNQYYSGSHIFSYSRKKVNSRVILVLVCLPAVTKVINISDQRAVWFGEVVVWIPIVVPTETTHLVVVGAEGTNI